MKNLVIKAVLVFLALVVSGCEGWAPPPSIYTFELTGRKLDPDELEVIREAFEEWCIQSQGEYCGSIGTTENSGSELEMSTKNGYDVGHTGMWFGDKIAIYDLRGGSSSREMWIRNVYLTLLHELGHHFRGVGHLPTGNVMQPCGYSVGYLTEADVYGEYTDKIKTCQEAEEAAKKLGHTITL